MQQSSEHALRLPIVTTESSNKELCGSLVSLHLLQCWFFNARSSLHTGDFSSLQAEDG